MADDPETKRNGDSTLLRTDDVTVYTAGNGKVVFLDETDGGEDGEQWLAARWGLDTRDWR